MAFIQDVISNLVSEWLQIPVFRPKTNLLEMGCCHEDTGNEIQGDGRGPLPDIPDASIAWPVPSTFLPVESVERVPAWSSS